MYDLLLLSRVFSPHLNGYHFFNFFLSLVLSFTIFIIPLLVINKTCRLWMKYFSLAFFCLTALGGKKWMEGEG